MNSLTFQSFLHLSMTLARNPLFFSSLSGQGKQLASSRSFCFVVGTSVVWPLNVPGSPFFRLDLMHLTSQGFDFSPCPGVAPLRRPPQHVGLGWRFWAQCGG